MEEGKGGREGGKERDKWRDNPYSINVGRRGWLDLNLVIVKEREEGKGREGREGRETPQLVVVSKGTGG